MPTKTTTKKKAATKPKVLGTPAGAKKSVDGRIQRIGAGNGHWYKMDAKKCDGITGIINDSIPKPALVSWAAGAVAAFVYDDPEYIKQKIEKEGRKGFIQSMKDVPYQDRDIAANKGTQVHKLAEQLGRGEEVEVPEELVGHVESYLKYREDYEPKDEMIEVTVGSFKHRFMGTLDNWATLDNDHAVKNNIDGRCLIDIKTSRSGIWGETGLQLCGYGFSEFFLDANGEVHDLPKFDHYLGLWLRADGYDLYEFDVTEKTFRYFLYCQQVAHLTKNILPTIKGQAIAPPEGD